MKKVLIFSIGLLVFLIPHFSFAANSSVPNDTQLFSSFTGVDEIYFFERNVTTVTLNTLYVWQRDSDLPSMSAVFGYNCSFSGSFTPGNNAGPGGPAFTGCSFLTGMTPGAAISTTTVGGTGYSLVPYSLGGLTNTTGFVLFDSILSGGGAVSTLGGTAVDNDQAVLCKINSGYNGDCSPANTQAFSFNTPPPPSSPTISFIFPTNGLSTADFNNWNIRIQSYPGATPGAGVVVSYEIANASVLAPFQDFGAINQNSSDFNVLFPKSQPLAQFFVSSTPYTAEADLRSATGTIIATTSISFSITNEQFTVLVQQNGSTTTSTNNGISISPDTLNLTCTHPSSSFFSDPGSNFAYAGCAILTFFFQPSNSSVSTLGGALTNYENVFPFKIFFDIANGFETSTAAAANDSTGGGFSLSILGASHTVVSSSTIRNFVGTTTYNNYMAFSRGIVWAATGFLILHP